MAQDLAHKRPWLFASLVFGLSYPFAGLVSLAGTYEIIWKMLPLALLVPYALRRHHSTEFVILAAILAFCALGDGLIEIDLVAGGIAFGIGHMVAIWLFSRHRRPALAFSQKLLILAVLALTPLTAFLLAGSLAAAYSLLLAAMAAMAWSSSFSRYRVGLGAMLFVISDLLIFAREGQNLALPYLDAVIWYLYYAGMVMIATGVVQTLVKWATENPK